VRSADEVWPPVAIRGPSVAPAGDETPRLATPSRCQFVLFGRLGESTRWHLGDRGRAGPCHLAGRPAGDMGRPPAGMHRRKVRLAW